jgi:RNA polymerase sigma factor (TIGR02999 family)
MSDVTQILHAIGAGEPDAAGRLLPVVYDELRKLAAAKLAREKPGQTLQATALVHEAYIRLVGAEHAQHWDSRGHFFAAAAEAMRRILVEQARKRSRREAIVGSQVPLEERALATEFGDKDLLRLDEALQDLESRDPVAAKLTKLRFFGGLTMEEAADSLGLPLRTAERNWAYARSWLHRELEDTAS